MKLLKCSILSLLMCSPHIFATIGAGHVSGKITNITSVESGILIRIEANEVPQNCTSNEVWMEIKQSKTAIISLTITSWTLGRGVSVYTAPASAGYCQVAQVDPFES